MTTQIQDNTCAAGIWQKVLQRIKSELSEQSYNIWLEPVRLVEAKNNLLVLSVPDQFYTDWIKDHYEDLIKNLWFETCGGEPAIEFSVREEAAKSHKYSARHLSPVKPKEDPLLNKRFRFENFIVGSSNQFAFAAMQAIATAPAKSYNPFFLYGPVGLGKTHLLQALAQEAAAKHPSSKIVYTSSERFTNQLIAAIQNRQTAAFRSTYRAVDILLIDDIHFIAGKESTQEEFFHTFNTLYDAHKQIIVSSDRPPKEIPALEERLVSRFGWGLIADIQPPDLETRIAILRKKLADENKTVSDDVISFIASKIKSNIRELEGAMIRVVAYSALVGETLNLQLAEKVLKDTVREEENKISIESIQEAVARHFDIKVADLRAKTRNQRIVRPRQIAMYLVRKLTKSSLLEIGEYFGGRDHSTVIHSCSKVENALSKDEGEKQIVGEIESHFKSV
ncbi:MAG: chromosomal replication initiator protein DnaA [Candidatus Omnitrophica bacterium]|nr:chromosomal replication initiator protein DnaA [Candidatus Omnitrophota bacterium]